MCALLILTQSKPSLVGDLSQRYRLEEGCISHHVQLSLKRVREEGSRLGDYDVVD